jgi:hypothetical protein
MDFDGRDARERELPRPVPDPRVPALAPECAELARLTILSPSMERRLALLLYGQLAARTCRGLDENSSGPARGGALSAENLSEPRPLAHLIEPVGAQAR